MNRTAMLSNNCIGKIGIVHDNKPRKVLNKNSVITKTYCLILSYSKDDWNYGVYTYLDDKGVIRKTDPYGGYPKIKIYKK